MRFPSNISSVGYSRFITAGEKYFRWNCGELATQIFVMLVVVHYLTCITIFFWHQCYYIIMCQLLLLGKQKRLLGWSLLCSCDQSFTHCSPTLYTTLLLLHFNCFLLQTVMSFRSNGNGSWKLTIFFVQEHKIWAGWFVSAYGSVEILFTVRCENIFFRHQISGLHSDPYPIDTGGKAKEAPSWYSSSSRTVA